MTRRWRPKPLRRLLLFYMAMCTLVACATVEKSRRSPSVGSGTTGTGSGSSRPQPDRVEPPKPPRASIPAPRTSRQTASLHLAETAKPLMRKGQYALALRRLEKALDMDPSNSRLYFYIGEAHYGLGNFEASLEFLEVAGSMLSNEAVWMTQIFTLRGDNWRALGSPGKARQAYSRALALSPNSAEALRHLRALEDGSSSGKTR